jgi:hypothetical protein
MMKMDELIIKKKRGEVLSGLQISWEKKNHLKTGQETPATPPAPPIENSSALPLKSLITLPVLTSKIFITTL